MLMADLRRAEAQTYMKYLFRFMLLTKYSEKAIGHLILG